MRRARLLGALVPLVALATAGCTAAGPEPAAETTSDVRESETRTAETRTAERLVQVSDVHEATGLTLVEGPVLGPDGDLYVVDVAAPPGAPKVVRIDLGTEEVTTVYTDETRAITSAQFSPYDGRLYLTDFLGTIISTTAEGEDARVFFSGEVDGVPMAPDDISFDDDGHLFVTDSRGARDPYWEATGRLVRLDRDSAAPTVLADGLAAPNGLAFTPEADGLWVSLNTANQIDFLRLDAQGTAVVSAHPAVFAGAGQAQVDSLATDADGNLYVGLHHRAAILVFDTDGDRIATIEPPDGDTGVTSATNLAISPGETSAYATFSGPEGGFVYAFDALAAGTRASNGG